MSLFLTIVISFNVFGIEDSDLISMDERYRTSDIRNRVHIDESKLINFEYYLKNGLLYSSKNHKVANFWFEQNIVIGRDGKIFILSQNPFLNHYHSSPVRGEKVFFAGEVGISKGQISFISNGSGHYKPDFKAVFNLIMYLKLNNVDIERIAIKLYSGNKLDSTRRHFGFASEFITYYEKMSGGACKNFYNAFTNNARVRYPVVRTATLPI